MPPGKTITRDLEDAIRAGYNLCTEVAAKPGVIAWAMERSR